jgi:predicted ester cyclase
LPLGSLVGRAEAIREVLALLGSSRLVTLTGAGGSGKTRLALEVGAVADRRFADGVAWVELAALRDPGAVPAQIATALGLGETKDRPVIDLIAGALAGRRVLLILDNCEQVIGACAELAEVVLQRTHEAAILGHLSRPPGPAYPARLANTRRTKQMSGSIRETAERFFETCESGKGWDACQPYCHANATFSAQAGALAGVDTLQAYAEWVKGLFTPMPDNSYEVRSLAVDEARGNVVACSIFRGTHTGPGGPVPPTGKRAETDYVYLMQFDGDRIRHMTKIWNDGFALKQLGWM